MRPFRLGRSVLHTRSMPLRSRLCTWLVVGLIAVGALRALLLWSHEPLFAYANTYDQVRYSACFDIYPDRPPQVPPDENSPNAPYEYFRFQRVREPMCYWSTELVFGALATAIWRLAEGDSTERVHSIRLIGAFKLASLLALSIGLSVAWWRRRAFALAIANAALLPLVFGDPGNTLYLNTFYAEWSALLAAYALFGLLALWHGEASTRARWVILALVALLLAASKMQHIVLPLCLGLALLALHVWRQRRIGWQAPAVLVGALLGASLQFAQMQREGPLMDSIRQFNRAHVIFTALLPVADDKPALLAEIGVDPRCAIYSGQRAWQMPGLPETVCPGVLAFGYVDQIRVLLTSPLMTLALTREAIVALDPWIAENIGQVEGAVLGEIDDEMFSVGVPLRRWPALQWMLVALPVIALAALVASRRGRRAARLLEFTASVVVTMLATLTITVLGDGLADTAKQGHLVINAALAWLTVVLTAAAAHAVAARSAELSR